MKILTPTTITDSVLVSSTVAEDDYALWNAATAYTLDAYAIRPNHHIYKRIVAGTTATAPENDVVNWLDTGMTNRWRMFDQKVGTVTSATTSMTITLAPGIVTSVALVNISAYSVRVKMTDSVEGVVYDQTFTLYDPVGINNWWSYFFEDVRRRESLVVSGLPSYRNAQVEITLSDSEGATVSVGSLIVGRLQQYVEAVEHGASVGVQDYGRKEVDDWGNYYVVERAFAKRARWNFYINNYDIDKLQRQLTALRSKPTVYIGSDAYDATIIYGFYRDFDIVISYPKHSECSIEIEGLT